ncbi:MAG: hypothetical protein U9R44_00020 [Candidatus Omnitrophota bacterium]|nr:hypothetical protein [Candidatus Omnitrophota bacterium]
MFGNIAKIFLAGLFTFGVISVSDAADDTTLQKKYWDNGKVRVVKKVNQLGDLEEVAYYRKDGTLEQHVKYDADDRKVEESY